MSEIYHDPVTGITRKWTFDRVNDKVVIETTQEVSGILDENKYNFNDDDNTRKAVKRGFVHYAEIPHSVGLKWMKEHGINIYSGDREQTKAAFKLLNSREYRYLKRTSINHS